MSARDDQHAQIRQLIKQAMESPTASGLVEFLAFTSTFRRLAVWNARMVYIQRPGARVVASEYEWTSVGRKVSPDAVPIIILWPFGPIRFVYELEDTLPPIDRSKFDDPFAVDGQLRAGVIDTLTQSLKRQKSFRIRVEPRRQGFSYAGSAASQGMLPITQPDVDLLPDDRGIGTFAHQNANTETLTDQVRVPSFRVTVNDRLNAKERFVTIVHELGHIFSGHLGSCAVRNGKEDESGWPDRRALGRDEKEVEAESVAYLVASRAGLTTGSAAYLTKYASRADLSRIDLDLIVRAAARIERLGKIRYGSMSFHEDRS